MRLDRAHGIDGTLEPVLPPDTTAGNVRARCSPISETLVKRTSPSDPVDRGISATPAEQPRFKRGSGTRGVRRIELDVRLAVAAGGVEAGWVLTDLPHGGGPTLMRRYRANQVLHQ